MTFSTRELAVTAGDINGFIGLVVDNLSVLAFVREVRHVRRPELAETTVSS